MEEPERTVTTEGSVSVGNPCLLITEYLGNQVQSETYYDTRSSLERHFKYDYDEQGSLKSFEWITLEHFYALSPNDPDYDGLFVELTQGENGKFTGTQDNVDVEIEVHENGTIKKRALLFDNQYEDAYTVGAEFDEQGRRISDYYREEDNSLGIICQYAHEGNELFSRTCSVTEISTMSETPIGPSGEGETQVIRREKTIECSIGRGENNLLTSVYINEEEINVDFEYASNGRLISSATTYYNDSIIMEKNTVTFSYYDTGFVSQAVEKEYGENNQLQREYVYTYNEQGLQTHYEYMQYNSDGIINSLYSTTTEYDDNGKKIKNTNTRYEINTSNVLIRTQLQIVEYDDTGYVSSTTHYNVDGSYSVKVEEYEYGQDGYSYHLVKETRNDYDNNEALYKTVVKEYKNVSNEQGGWSRLTTKETTTNYNADGSVEKYNVVENEYNDKNKCIKITTTQYTANNVVEYKNVQEYTYDENGNEIKHKLTKYGVNCVLQSITDFEYVIHANTRYTVKETDKKYSNGILSETRIQTWEYHDNWKSEHHTIHEIYYLSDGNIDEEEITEYIYNDEQADRLMKVIRTDIDYDYTEEYYYKRVFKREENSEQKCLQSTQTDYRANGTIIEQHDYKYNEDGTIDVFTFVSYDENEAIKEYSREEHSYQFDNEGSLIKDLCHEYDMNNSLIAEFIYGYDNDKVMTRVETYFTLNGVIDHKYEYEYEYTNTGSSLTTKEISTFYTDEGEVDYVIIENYEYDDNNKKCKIEEQYYNGTTLEYIRVQEGTTIYMEEHHAHFFFSSKETYTAYNPNGSIEYQTKRTYTYDDNWNCLSTRYIKYDSNGNIIEEGSL